VKAINEIYERSGCASQVDFRLRYILSQPNVLTTIGGASKVERLNLYLDAERNFEPLDRKIIESIEALHRQWYA
jgi:aryl-alcohol dehydrogenase-like predicted oxidoreductase